MLQAVNGILASSQFGFERKEILEKKAVNRLILVNPPFPVGMER
jgi:hypothetical protein